MKRSIWFKLLLTAIFCLSLAATVFAEPSKQITLDEFEIGGIGVGTSLDTVVMKYGLPTKQSSFNYNRLIKGMIYKYGDLLTVEAIPKSDGGTSVIGVVCKNPKLFTPGGFAVGRTIFQEPSRAWMAGEMDDETLIEQVQATFEQLITAWRSSRT